LDRKLAKITIGFALQSAIPHWRDTEALLALYSDPNLEKARILHDELAVSRNHCDREVAIWLQGLHEHGPSELDIKALMATMREMESILYFLINQVGEAQREVNDWMNYIANSAESLADGFWIDAKIFLSHALEISQSMAIERLKSDLNLKRKLDILQRATAQYFAEIRTLPSKLAIPEDRLEVIMAVQKVLLDLMQAHYQGRHEENDEVLGIAIRRLNTTIRHLMTEDKEIETAKQEMQLISEYLNEKQNKIVDERRRELARECGERMEELAETRTP